MKYYYDEKFVRTSMGMPGRVYENWNSHTLLVGMYTTWGSNLAAS